MTAPTLRRPLPAGTTTDERTWRPMADDGRTYIRVHDGMPDHPKVEPLTDKAFRLLVETWAWCSRHRTDGHVPRAVWTRRGTPASRRELLAAQLIEEHGTDGIVMHDYLDWQRSKQQVDKYVSDRKAKQSRAGAKANHTRWHTGPDGTPSADCDLCDTGPSADPIGSDSDPVSDGEADPNRNPSGSLIGRGRGREVLPSETLGGRAADSNARAEPPPTPNRSADERPAERCERHAGHVGDPGPCRSCGDARAVAERWDADTARARVKAVRACRWCDGDGWRVDPDNPQRGAMPVRCDHTPLAEHLAEASR